MCLGDIVTYECTIGGNAQAGATVWSGSAFECPTTNNQLITVLPLRNTSHPIIKTCGDITARFFHTEQVQGNYTSELSLHVTAEAVGSTVSCSYDDGISIMLIFSTVVMITGMLTPQAYRKPAIFSYLIPNV